MKQQVSIAIDIGGTWIKGTIYNCPALTEIRNASGLASFPSVRRVKSHLSQHATTESFISALDKLISLLLTSDMELCSVGISTAGVVNYAGNKIEFVAPHLTPLKSELWLQWLKNTLKIPVVLINDADAVTIGASVLGYLKGSNSIGIMPVGTGLGFTVWRNSRRLRPNYNYTLLGCISTSSLSYDQMASVVNLAKVHPEENLPAVFTDKKYAGNVDRYIHGLAKIIQTSYYLYHTNEILLGGGLADAVTNANYPLAERLNELLSKEPVLDGSIPYVRLLHEGNHLPLLGAALLAHGEAMAQNKKHSKEYNGFATEKAYDPSLHLEKMKTHELVNLLWNVEQEAGSALAASLNDLTEVIEKIVYSLKNGGRLIYVGSGTSGRLAAIDTVEIACTFGLPRDRVLTFISGSVADAAFDIETNFEEDASCVPEMLIASVNKKDILVGISVSGSAYYVQSALAYAKAIGAYSVLIQEEAKDRLPFCDKIIPLRTGHEVIAGSTRMKAGTATKKVLNILSTIAMIRLGKIHGSYMTHMECINKKLILRAQNILKTQYALSENDSIVLLKKHKYSLNEAIYEITKNRKQ